MHYSDWLAVTLRTPRPLMRDERTGVAFAAQLATGADGASRRRSVAKSFCRPRLKPVDSAIALAGETAVAWPRRVKSSLITTEP